MSKKNFDPNIGKDTRFGAPNGNDPTKGGRKKTRPLKDLMNKLDDKNFEIRIPKNQCEILDDEIVIKLPSVEALAVVLQQNSLKDVHWFRERAKIMGDYAPTKVAKTDPEGKHIDQMHIVTMDELIAIVKK